MRLDNRDEMLIRIGLTPGEAILGDFEGAVARVGEARRRCVADAARSIRRRDLEPAEWHFDAGPRSGRAQRPHVAPQRAFFAFATMPNGLFALDEVCRELNEEKFADFLVLNHAEHETTIYKDIFRVRPAHIMRVHSGGAATQHRYWSPDDLRPVRLPSDQDYAEGLRECLDVAVRRQMRSAHPIGCLLSGGLDSSSVAILAAGALAETNQRLTAFTGVPRRAFKGPVPAGHYADETHFVDAIAKKADNVVDVTYVQNERSNGTTSERLPPWKGRSETRPTSAGS